MSEEEEKSVYEKLREFYSKTTAEHVLRPRNNADIPNPDGFASHRSGCSETMEIRLALDGGKICRTGFWTDGCAATIACGSMATELAKGRTTANAMSISAREIADALEDFPETNFHCAMLAAQTLHAALLNSVEISRDPWKKLYRK